MVGYFERDKRRAESSRAELMVGATNRRRTWRSCLTVPLEEIENAGSRGSWAKESHRRTMVAGGEEGGEEGRGGGQSRLGMYKQKKARRGCFSSRYRRASESGRGRDKSRASERGGSRKEDVVEKGEQLPGSEGELRDVEVGDRETRMRNIRLGRGDKGEKEKGLAKRMRPRETERDGERIRKEPGGTRMEGYTVERWWIEEGRGWMGRDKEGRIDGREQARERESARGWYGTEGKRERTLLTPPSIQDGVGSGSPRH
ncbi:hypothetical protein ALC56_03791 [Trachymyrmex septentrionalis]|uniref:Uncharacterized protein n=1 Tax=Trachymyrmex septentrionalis TaxID=34720 RepID=A0A195FN94_9HYME|nr:hypothetical protein ALC56_03791 [Trachymyrmex septentrionalis]